MPVALGEVACAAIGGRIYVVGEGSSQTLSFDTATRQWSTSHPARPHPGHHHAAESLDGKWYLIGGLGGGEGKVQIFDTATSSWSLGADMPWAGGSVSTCRIGGRIYAAGGIVGGTTVDHCAAYDIGSNTWIPLAPMPFQKGRNHAAAGTDGTRFWIFGGRGVGSGAGNTVANGFADVQVYDPASDTWTASYLPGSGLSPLPIGRGGMGKAVYHQGEFLIFGGETLDGPGAVAGNVYDRVDVYDVGTNTWRLATPMRTPRHGIFPVVHRGRIFVPGGGVVAGFSTTSVMDAFGR
jgi:N-acetylneuraminic acid mutarotase